MPILKLVQSPEPYPPIPTPDDPLYEDIVATAQQLIQQDNRRKQDGLTFAELTCYKLEANRLADTMLRLQQLINIALEAQ